MAATSFAGIPLVLPAAGFTWMGDIVQHRENISRVQVVEYPRKSQERKPTRSLTPVAWLL
ncbi:MAG: hypothetical protein DRI34_13435 [Deltaproteobacteria bacterium]|nr:MAG: hypothetical protein DRI34_13435 [Deltaproteobacteria bacterium]